MPSLREFLSHLCRPGEPAPPIMYLNPNGRSDAFEVFHALDINANRQEDAYRDLAINEFQARENIRRNGIKRG